MAVKKTSDERREQVIQAAVKEFAANGFHATSTSAIAKRAGISQPYIYALFRNKRELFLAADRHVVDRIRRAFLDASRGKDSPAERRLRRADVRVHGQGDAAERGGVTRARGGVRAERAGSARGTRKRKLALSF